MFFVDFKLHEKFLNCFEIKFNNNQILKSLETLNRHDQTHNDIKPQNFLVKFDTKFAGQSVPDFTKIKIVLTDFGLAESGSKGGTPIFASPECFEKKHKPSDLYSLGRVILFLLVQKDEFSKLLFVPIKNSTRLLSIKRLISISKDLSFHLVLQMTSLKNRISLEEARKRFDRLRKYFGIKPKHDLPTILKMMKIEISDDDELYVQELCDFRYKRSKSKTKIYIFPVRMNLNLNMS